MIWIHLYNLQFISIILTKYIHTNGPKGSKQSVLTVPSKMLKGFTDEY